MWLFIVLFFFSLSLSADVDFTYTPTSQQKYTKTSDNKQFELLIATQLVTKTKTGLELKPYIDELLQLDKIHLTKLQKGHYGESGEGCAIKAGKYFYEGLFVMLNDSLSTAELASSLVHEVSHYRMIKDLVALNFKFPVKVAAFEISAFASQYEFISELEGLKLVDSQLMFAGDSNTVSEIMRNAYKLRVNWSDNDYDKVFNQLVDYGYTKAELNRTISQRTEKNCFGNADQ